MGTLICREPDTVSASNDYTDKDNYNVIGSMGDRWTGKGAEALGLGGCVDQKVFKNVLEGRLPDGSDLSRSRDGANKHRPGYDLTFSAPKSISVMAMLGGDTQLIDAHNRAVDTAIKQVEAIASTQVMTEGKSETVLDCRYVQKSSTGSVLRVMISGLQCLIT